MNTTGRVTAVTDSGAFGQSADRRSGERRSAVSPQSRALVVTPSASHATKVGLSSPQHSLAPFVAHLVAMREQAPQMRLQRRAEPAFAANRYIASRDKPTSRPAFIRSV